MKKESWIRVRELFEAASGLEPGRRRPFLLEESRSDLREVRSEVLRLLDFEERIDPGFLEPVQPTSSGFIPPTGSTVAALGPGDRLGSFTIGELLGSGGMGAVHAAEQERPRRTVALKTLRPGYASESRRQRFQQEAEVLGRLRHPSIAQIYEAGISDEGVLYFAMEYVPDARDILTHARRRQLDRSARLQLVIEIAQAVHHGHTKGVIHRDLKPGNLLVDEHGNVKVIDFGVARTIDPGESGGPTIAGELVGTLAYMSPEQLAGESDAVDTRSDVYALGVCLYELLTGTLPHDLGDMGLERRIEVLRTREPALSPDLPRELRWVLGKALSIDPARRYDSASQFAFDLQRVLDHEPVLASPPSVPYHLAKLARRHRLAIAAGVAVVMALAIGLVRAERSARIARAEAKTAQGVTRALQHMLTRIDPMEAGEDVRLLDSIEQAETWLTEDTELTGKARASFQRVLGLSYSALGNLEASGRVLEAAHRWHQSEGSPEDPEAIALDIARVRQLLMGGQFEASLDLALDTEVRALAVHEPDHEDTLKLQSYLAETYLQRGNGADVDAPTLVEAVRRFLENVAAWERRRGPDDTEPLGARGGLALVWMHRGELDRARTEFEAILSDCLRVFPPEHFRIQNARVNLGQVLQMSGDYAGAVEQYEAVTRRLSERFGPDHYYLFPSLANGASCYIELGREEEALANFERLVPMAVRQYGASPITFNWAAHHGELLRKRGLLIEADEMFDRIWGEVGGEEHSRVVEAFLDTWFEVLQELQRGDEVRWLAEEYCASAPEGREWCAGRE